jgi:hypothetical protein
VIWIDDGTTQEMNKVLLVKYKSNNIHTIIGDYHASVSILLVSEASSPVGEEEGGSSAGGASAASLSTALEAMLGLALTVSSIRLLISLE